MADDDDQHDDDTPTLTQAQANAIATREARQAERRARQAAETELADQLGCTVDEAKAIIAKSRKDSDDAKDEATRLRDEAAEAKRQADADRATAKAERLAAKVERRLTAAGVSETALARAARMVNLDPEADDDAISAEIDALKDEVPALFTTAADDTGTPPPPPPPAGGGPRPTPATGKSAAERARERHDARKSRPGFHPTAA